MPDFAQIPPVVILTIIFALAFDYINGFHDTANSIATVVSTRVMTPRSAIIMAAGLNFIGALMAHNVSKTISHGLVDPSGAPQTVVLAAVIAGIVWNLITWRYGIPSSSSHALIGGLVGAAIVHAGTDVVKWEGVIHKVVLPLFLSPMLGFLVGWLIMHFIYRVFADAHPGKVGGGFRMLQRFSAAFMAYSHGMNDAQKSMGIIMLALVAGGMVPESQLEKGPLIWVMVACAAAMALGTSAGGWRIIRTMGHKIIRLEPVHGFAAETAAATVITLASRLGMPVSTTHVIAGSIFGVGCSKRASAVRWGVAIEMVIAWFLTLPAAAGLSAAIYWLLEHVFHI